MTSAGFLLQRFREAGWIGRIVGQVVSLDGPGPAFLAARFLGTSTQPALQAQGSDSRDALDASGSTPLHLAAFSGARGVVEVLIRHQADLETRRHCMTPRAAARATWPNCSWSSAPIPMSGIETNCVRPMWRARLVTTRLPTG
jgi:hypothetical protein